MDSTIVYVGLGSNLADPVSQVQRAYHALGKVADDATLQLSPLYASKAVGPAGQPDYINAVARLKTKLSPIQLLNALQNIELQQQRVRAEHWGPRTIDLDILLYGNVVISTPRLSVPHAYLTSRNFVLAPMLDLNPELCLPDQTPVARLLAELGMSGLALLSQTTLRSR